MATYLNPGNSGFEKMLNDSYVDKTGMIELINNTIDTPRCLTCISRPRRFGKSYAAQMLCAYYDKSCNSSELFEDKAIADSYSYEEHLNRYDVIYVDMTSIKIYADNYEKLVPYLCHALTKEITQAYPELPADQNLTSLMINAVEVTGTKFIMIIDEWDAPIRENPSVSQEYLHFLYVLTIQYSVNITQIMKVHICLQHHCGLHGRHFFSGPSILIIVDFMIRSDITVTPAICSIVRTVFFFLSIYLFPGKHKDWT